MSSRLIATQIIQQVIESKFTLTYALRNNESFKQAGDDKALIQRNLLWVIQMVYPA